MAPEIPEHLAPLLTGANFGVLATIRPDDTPQVTPMWFEFDGEHVRFTHTTKRRKFRNLQRNPAMAFAVSDPQDPYRYIEVRGRLVEVLPDPEAEFYMRLNDRYGKRRKQAPPDKADRVVLVMNIETVSGSAGGPTRPECPEPTASSSARENAVVPPT